MVPDYGVDPVLDQNPGAQMGLALQHNPVAGLGHVEEVVHCLDGSLEEVEDPG